MLSQVFPNDIDALRKELDAMKKYENILETHIQVHNVLSSESTAKLAKSIDLFFI